MIQGGLGRMPHGGEHDRRGDAEGGTPDRWMEARPARRRGFRLVQVRLLAPVAAVVLAAAGYGLSQIGRGPSPGVRRPAFGGVCIQGGPMQGGRVGHSLAVRLPAAVVEALELKACSTTW